MKGRAFLDVARDLIHHKAEAYWRAAAGRAYYALMLEGRELLDQWGFPVPPRDQVHAFVRLRFTYAADSDLKKIGYALDRLVTLRNQADYQVTTPKAFLNALQSNQAIRIAETHIALLDQIDSDQPRRLQAIADMRAAWP